MSSPPASPYSGLKSAGLLSPKLIAQSSLALNLNLPAGMSLVMVQTPESALNFIGALTDHPLNSPMIPHAFILVQDQWPKGPPAGGFGSNCTQIPRKPAMPAPPLGIVRF